MDYNIKILDSAIRLSTNHHPTDKKQYAYERITKILSFLKQNEIELYNTYINYSYNKVTLLMALCDYGYNDIALQIINDGCNINSVNYRGKTALMYAIKNKLADVCYLLIEKECNLNNQNHKGKTALMFAINYQLIGVCNRLIDNNHCDLNILDISNHSALDYILHIICFNSALIDLYFPIICKIINSDRYNITSNTLDYMSKYKLSTITKLYYKKNLYESGVVDKYIFANKIGDINVLGEIFKFL